MIKLRALNLHINTGRTFVAVLNRKDAVKYDLHEGDRVRIYNDGKSAVALIDTAYHDKVVKPGYIGMMEELEKELDTKNTDRVSVKLEPRPVSVNYIKQKMNGEKLSRAQIETIVQDIVDNKLSDIELTYFISACYSNVMSDDEVIALTKAMVSTGETLKINKKIIMDKHCIGGVAGNRTTMLIVPILASLGLAIPKTSSRSITSASGTADTMEVLTEVCISIKKMKQIVEKLNGCIVWGGALNLAPADDKIIYVERPMNIDSESQLIASIMSKKHSVGSTHILIDIPIGRGAKVANRTRARTLERQFVKIGKKLGKTIKVIITDGSQPIGNGIGPALEARDVLWILKRDPRGPKDLEKKGLYMARTMLEMAGVKDAKRKASESLEDGSAYEKMIEIIEAQGRKAINPNKIKIGKYCYDVCAEKSGKLTHLDNEALCKIARVAGAPIDKGAGIYLHKHVGSTIKKRERIYTIHAESRQALKYAIDVGNEIKSYEIK